MTKAREIWDHILTVKQQSPLVHNITNFVVMNNTANALLAAGASPIMAHGHKEVCDMAAAADSVVINMGTLDEYGEESMIMAARTAHLSAKPWILDPVGLGATPYRTEVLSELLPYKPNVIRGNASEIMAIANTQKPASKGVDSVASSQDALETAKIVARKLNCVVCVSGDTDFIVGEKQQVTTLNNGHPNMTKVTGMGCTASALIGAFIGVLENYAEATLTAMALLGVAGELAAEQSQGPGSLQVSLLDQLHGLSEDEFLKRLKISQQ